MDDLERDEDDLDHYELYGVLFDDIEAEREELEEARKAERQGDKGDDSDTDDEEELDDEQPSGESKDVTVPSNRIVGNTRTTLPIMTKYEYSRVISALAEMYAAGLPVDDNLKPHIVGMIDPIDVAEMHLKMRFPCPVTVERPMSNRTLEIFYPHEMCLPDQLLTIGLVGKSGDKFVEPIAGGVMTSLNHYITRAEVSPLSSGGSQDVAGMKTTPSITQMSQVLSLPVPTSFQSF